MDDVLPGWRADLDGKLLDLRSDRRRSGMGRSGHDLTAGDEFNLQVVARLFAAAEIAKPGGE